MTLKEIDQNVNASNIDDKIIGLRIYIEILQLDAHKNRLELCKCVIRLNNFVNKSDRLQNKSK